MKGVLICLWLNFLIIDCCSVQDPDNAFLSCRTNYYCEVQCYQGYIFPTGKTKANYSCKQVLSGMVLSCKRIPIVVLEYTAVWDFHKVPPSGCDNIYTMLNKSEEMIEDVLRICNSLPVHVNMTFTFMTSRTTVFLINTTFTGTYYNFTSTEVFDACVSLQLDQLENQTLPFIESIFENTKCFKERIKYARRSDWHIDGRQEHCPIGTEVKNVTVTELEEDVIEYYCESAGSTTYSTWGTGFQYFTYVATSFISSNTKAVDYKKASSLNTDSTWEMTTSPAKLDDTKPANYTAIYIAAPVLVTVSLFLIISTMLYYKTKSRAIKRKTLYQTIFTMNDNQTNDVTNDSHTYDVMAFREKSNEISRY